MKITIIMSLFKTVFEVTRVFVRVGGCDVCINSVGVCIYIVNIQL